MKTQYLILIAAVVMSTLPVLTRAELLQVTLPCAGEYNWDNPYWTGDFDLEVSFSEISHVYIDWSGQITAGLIVHDSDPDMEPIPFGVGVYASLGFNPSFRHSTVIGGGADVYPASQPFACLTEIELTGLSTWSDLLDGQGSITIQYTEPILLTSHFVESGLIALDNASLIVDGIVVPEPSTFAIIIGGVLGFRWGKRRSL